MTSERLAVAEHGAGAVASHNFLGSIATRATEGLLGGVAYIGALIGALILGKNYIRKRQENREAS